MSMTTFWVALPHMHVPFHIIFLVKDCLYTAKGVQTQITLSVSLCRGGGAGFVFLSSTLLANSPMGGKEGSGKRKRQIPQLANVIKMYTSLKSALGSLSFGFHLSGSPRHLLELQLCAKGWRKQALSQVSFFFCEWYQKGQSMMAKSVCFFKYSCFVEGLFFSPISSLKNLLCVKKMKPEDNCCFDGWELLFWRLYLSHS